MEDCIEAAKPIFVPTPMPQNEEYSDIYEEKDKAMIEIKSFELKLTNGKYKLELAKSESKKYIIIKCYNIKQQKIKYFISYYSVKSFHNLNDFFKWYTNLDELYNLLLDTITKNKYSIKIKDINISIDLEFIMPGDKIIDISFDLKETKAKYNELVEQLNESVNQISEENEAIKEEIKSLKIENNNLKEEIKTKNEETLNIKKEINNIYNELKNLKEENREIKEKLKLFEKFSKNNIIEKEEEKREQIEEPKNIIENKEYPSIKKETPRPGKETPRPKKETPRPNCESSQSSIKQSKEEKNEDKKDNNIIEEKNLCIKKNINLDNVFKESKLVRNEEDKKNLINWISSKGNINEIKLIYRATENGDDSESFFSKCSNKGPTISLIKTANNRIFGGFTKAEWTNKKGKIRLKDENTFLFSLNNGEKYNILEPDKAISCYPDDLTLVYGNKEDRYGIRLFSNFLEKTCYENLKNRVFDVPSEYCLTGYNKFNVQEVEVFQVIFE